MKSKKNSGDSSPNTSKENFVTYTPSPMKSKKNSGESRPGSYKKKRKTEADKNARSPIPEEICMWKADHYPEIEKKILDWELNLPLNRICSDLLNNQAMMFVEKIYHMENELSLKSNKHRNSNEWIKELYEACQQEMKQTKDTLNKIYELKNYYKPILNREDNECEAHNVACQNKCSNYDSGYSCECFPGQRLQTCIDQELYAFGLNSQLWIGARNETAPPGCGSIPMFKNNIICAGEYVAAFVIPDQKMVGIPDQKMVGIENGPALTPQQEIRNARHTNREDLEINLTGVIKDLDCYADLNDDGTWILARCICPPEGEEKDYKVADIDDIDDKDENMVWIDDPGTNDSKLVKAEPDKKPDIIILGKALPHFKIPRKALIPLPISIPDPKYNPEAIFPIGTDVLALYKGTTSFFPAVVEDTPKSTTDTYMLRFRDENEKIQNQVYLVSQKYVLEYRVIDDIFSKEETNQLKFLKKIENDC